ncbi:hypothetical protein BP5796_08713 [Coleophoma crateriformis]|uniref:RNase MRP protein 1 RNA binding domain-containing protein n=1 Tax=Coleophoma crateriformis TaxID=565419 RepID=A0A3D8R8L8_9HELO|nr:hypothetical protein BP5796_08713 [Coleophoma crateriformis]
MSAQPLSSIPTELASLSNLLCLSHHRNKNQHRLSRWWAQFSQLRRCISKLETEIQLEPHSLLPPGDQQALLERGKGKKQKPGKAKRESRVRRRVEFMQDFLIPKCFVAFGNLVADNQYAPLGLMLMACLARTSKVIKPLGWEREMERQRQREDEDRDAEMDGKAGPDEVAREKLEVDGVDLGEKVEREQVLEEGNRDESEVTASKVKRSRKEDRPGSGETATEPREVSSKKPKKKKRKKGGDAFDDLFDSLM